MKQERRFPVLFSTSHDMRRMIALGWNLADVPWDFVAKHRDQCQWNHSQTPERLAERGGLGICEMLAVVTHRPWPGRADTEDDVRELLALLKVWEANQ